MCIHSRFLAILFIAMRCYHLDHTELIPLFYFRFVQGYPSANCYRIYHWQYINIFIYFSHNFITIPPPCWTNAAHKHGVVVLGTFITEWHDGAARCAEIFKDQFSYKQVADQLVSIAMYYGFDGWLMNIENPVQVVQNLLISTC